MNSIDLLNKMLDLYFEANDSGVKIDGIRYVGTMSSILSELVDIVIVINENCLTVMLHLDIRKIQLIEKETRETSVINYASSEGEYPVLASKTFSWRDFTFTSLLTWINENGKLDKIK